MGVALQVRKVADHIAKGRQNSLANYVGGTDLWTLIDAAENETFENRMVGTRRTAADDSLESGNSWNVAALRNFLVDLRDYCYLDLGLASPFFDSALALWGFRVPWQFAEAWYDAMGSRILPRNVFPRGTLVADGASPVNAGMHLIGTLTGGATPTYTSSAGAFPASVGVAPVVAIPMEATPGMSTVKMTMIRGDATTVDITLVDETEQYAQNVLGSQAITGVDGAVISCAATAQFKVGEQVLLYENEDGDTSLREVGVIKAGGIIADTSIELTAPPVNTFTTSGFILPMFSGISAYKSGSLGEGKTINFYGLPDRIIAL